MKNKKCVVENCDYGIFTHGYCKMHSYLYYNTKEKKIKQKTYKPTGEKALFDAIWNTRPHYSFISGKKLDPFLFMYFNMFAHVLPKGKYPDFRLYDKNIVLLTPEEHHLLDHGTQDQRDKYNANWQLIEDLRNQLIYEYEKE